MELLLHAFQGNIDVLIAHTEQKGLVRCGIHFPCEGHIFFRHAGQSLAHLGGIALGLGVDRHTVESVGVRRHGQSDVLIFCGQSVASGGDTELGDCADITAVDHADRQHFFAEGDLNTREAFFLVLVGIPNAGIGSDHTGIDLEVGLSPNKGISSGFPNICSQRTGILVRKFNFALGGLGFYSGQFGRARGEGNKDVQQGLDADVATASSDEHRDDVAVLDGFTQTLENFFGGQVAILKVFLKQAVFAFSCSFHQLGACFICFSFEIGRDLNRFFAVAFKCFHRNQVDHTLEVGFLTHR